MKQILFTSLLSILFLNTFAQTALPKSVINNFDASAYEDYKYGSRNITNAFIRELSNNGYDLTQAEIGIENLTTNLKVREAYFKFWYKMVDGSSNYLLPNLISFGMSPNNAKILTAYIIKNYGAKKQLNNNENIESGSSANQKEQAENIELSEE